MLATGLVAAVSMAAAPVASGARASDAAMRQADDFAPALLGVYRKVQQIDTAIVTQAKKYGVDPTLARAVCMFESGGNPNLTSGAGARGYFQVMPSTFRMLGVATNIEAGVKYLSQLVTRFGRADYALAAYNGGPSRVAFGRPMPLESLQYVLGISTYWSVLKAYEPAIRLHAADIHLTLAGEAEDWWALSRRLNVPVLQLRLHNPFLAARALRAGSLVAYPAHPRADLVESIEGRWFYRARLGDIPLNLAFMFGVDPDEFRDANQLWRLEPLLPGTVLELPAGPSTGFRPYTAVPGDTVLGLSTRFDVDPWQLVADNGLWDEVVPEGAVLRIRGLQTASRPSTAARPPAPRAVTHVVRRGDTLTSLAARYGTSVRAIQAANGLGRRTLVRIGQRLRMPR
jgi:LysM repeat protein